VTLSTFEGSADETQCLGSKDPVVAAQVDHLRKQIIAGNVEVADPMSN
jgi:hypothetical protein